MLADRDTRPDVREIKEASREDDARIHKKRERERERGGNGDETARSHRLSLLN